MKKLIVFDLDGTLASSKAPIDPEMVDQLQQLLKVVKVSIISGGDWPQFQKQVLANLPNESLWSNFFLLPTCGTKFYRYDQQWVKLYSEDLSIAQKTKIVDSLKTASGAIGPPDVQLWGEIIEDRGSQITFSALGQKAPIEAKEKWDPDFKKRKAMQVALAKLIPEFSVRLGGTTSVDVTMPGIDKGYGIHKLRDILKIEIEEMIFIGDAIFPGGNDYAAKEAGVYSIPVKDPSETKKVIEGIVACLTNEGETDSITGNK